MDVRCPHNNSCIFASANPAKKTSLPPIEVIEQRETPTIFQRRISVHQRIEISAVSSFISVRNTFLTMSSAKKRPLQRSKDSGEPETKIAKILCKKSCGRTISPGKTRRGNPFDICCPPCATSSSNPSSRPHSNECDTRNYQLSQPSMANGEGDDPFSKSLKETTFNIQAMKVRRCVNYPEISSLKYGNQIFPFLGGVDCILNALGKKCTHA